MSEIRIVHDSSAWGRDGFLKCLDDVSALGFWGIETASEPARQYYDKIYAFRQLLAEKSMHLAAMSAEADFSGDAEAVEKEMAFGKMVCEFLCNNRGKVFVFNASPRRPEGPSPDDLKRLADIASQIGDFCKALAIKVCILPRLGRIVENRAEMEKILELTDRSLVHICPDTGLLAKLGENPVDVIRANVGRIGHIHFKDYHPQPAPDAEGAYVELGRGCVDFPAIMEILHAANYSGCLTVELEKSDTSPKESAAINKAYIENVLGITVHPHPVPFIAEQPVRAPQPAAPAPPERAPAPPQGPPTRPSQTEQTPAAAPPAETPARQETPAAQPEIESEQPENIFMPPEEAAPPSPSAPEDISAPAAPEAEPEQPEPAPAPQQEAAPHETTQEPEQPPRVIPPAQQTPALPAKPLPPQPPRKEEKGFGHGIFPDEQDDE